MYGIPQVRSILHFILVTHLKLYGHAHDSIISKYGENTTIYISTCGGKFCGKIFHKKKTPSIKNIP